MKTKYNYLIFFSLLILAGACSREEPREISAVHTENASARTGGESAAVHLSELKINSLGIDVDSLQKRTLSGIVRVNGQLEVPPQHEATVTAVLGANVVSIEVIEGDFVTQNQVLAYLSHPNLTQVQTEYVSNWQRMNYLEQEYQRQKRLYDEEIGSGQQFQQTQAEYEAIRAEVKGYEARLKQLNLNAANIRDGTIYERIPVVSPIEGYVEGVEIQLGQFADPQTRLFEIVNNKHIHADFMVYERDVHKVRKGQKISFTVESAPQEELTATIYSVGKKFEQAPKAVHVHAEIDQEKEYLIPGMYINGNIQTSAEKLWALPEEAIVNDEGKTWMFLADQNNRNGKAAWSFLPVEIITGIRQGDWVEVKLLSPLPEGAQVAVNNAYYLIAEMKKSDTSHGH